jgi:hypothetical protein
MSTKVKQTKAKEEVTFVSTLRDLRKAIDSVIPGAKVEKVHETHYTVQNCILIDLMTICKWTPDGKKEANTCAPYAIQVAPTQSWYLSPGKRIKLRTFKQRANGLFDYKGICATMSQIMEAMSEELQQKKKYDEENKTRKEKQKKEKEEIERAGKCLVKMLPKKMKFEIDNDFNSRTKDELGNTRIRVFPYTFHQNDVQTYGISADYVNERELKDILKALSKIKFDKRERKEIAKIQDVD